MSRLKSGKGSFRALFQNAASAFCAPAMAWVVFSGQADRWWLRFLRPGFRHCYLIMNDGQRWLSLDPMLNHMDVQIHHDLPSSFDLPGWLHQRGLCVVPAPVSRTRTVPAPWRLFTCVEAVKRVLGIHMRGIFTPWQLYRYLVTTAACSAASIENNEVL